MAIEFRIASHQILAREGIDQFHGAIEPVGAPVEAVCLAGMINVDSRSVADDLLKLREPFNDSGAGR
jgi:hypothetical protein